MPIKHLFRPIQMTLAALTIGVAVSAGAASSVAPPVIGPSGMPTQAWFKESSNDLARDLADAVKSGKRLAIVWEQRGCYYCKRMHDVNFQVRDVVDYVRARFEFVQVKTCHRAILPLAKLGELISILKPLGYPASARSFFAPSGL